MNSDCRKENIVIFSVLFEQGIDHILITNFDALIIIYS